MSISYRRQNSTPHVSLGVADDLFSSCEDKAKKITRCLAFIDCITFINHFFTKLVFCDVIESLTSLAYDIDVINLYFRIQYGVQIENQRIKSRRKKLCWPVFNDILHDFHIKLTSLRQNLLSSLRLKNICTTKYIETK